jgi:hypothetical protein
MRIALSLLVFLVTGFAPVHAQGTSPLALVAVDATKLVLQSRLSGKRQEWLRVP